MASFSLWVRMKINWVVWNGQRLNFIEKPTPRIEWHDLNWSVLDDVVNRMRFSRKVQFKVELKIRRKWRQEGVAEEVGVCRINSDSGWAKYVTFYPRQKLFTSIPKVRKRCNKWSAYSNQENDLENFPLETSVKIWHYAYLCLWRVSSCFLIYINYLR